MKTCDNCHHWMKQRKAKEQFMGFCRRFPPIHVKGEWLHPKTRSDQTCGEFRPRTAKMWSE